ncbi:uncharacterized protein [Callorhinus ursinus]|uniref:uncharacterized protein n=1 Tax=Callorhinus ursinus TaxID=34884 RepID=UPI003CD04031
MPGLERVVGGIGKQSGCRSGEPRSEPGAQRPAAEAPVRDRAEARSGRAGEPGGRAGAASGRVREQDRGRQGDGRKQRAEGRVHRAAWRGGGRRPAGTELSARDGGPRWGGGPRVATSPERLPGPRRGACLLPAQPPQPCAPVSRVAGACEREARAASREDPFGGGAGAGAGAPSPEPGARLSITGSLSRDQIWKDVQLGRDYHSPPLLRHLPSGVVPSEGIAHTPIVSPPYPLHSCYSDFSL